MSDNQYNSNPVEPPPTRTYVIFNVMELNKVDFSLVGETSADTVRKSVDGTKTFVKWSGDTPAFVDNLTTKEGLYTLEEMHAILATPEWKHQPQSM